MANESVLPVNIFGFFFGFLVQHTVTIIILARKQGFLFFFSWSSILWSMTAILTADDTPRSGKQPLKQKLLGAIFTVIVTV